MGRDLERCRRDQVAVGDHRCHLGGEVTQLLLDLRIAQAARGEHRDAGLVGEDPHGARAQGAPAPAGGIGAGEHADHLVTRVEQGAEGGQGGFGGTGEEQTHDGTSLGPRQRGPGALSARPRVRGCRSCPRRPASAWPEMHSDVAGHTVGSPAFRRMLAALVCAGIATFAQLYSPQGVLEMISADLSIRAEQAALTISAATLALALTVVPWSFVGDRIGRLRAMVIAVLSATVLGLVAAWAPTFPLVLALRFLEGAALGGVPALAMAYLSEEMAPRARALGAGWFVAGTTVGGLMGRLVATPVADVLGWRAGVTVVALLSAVAAVTFLLTAPGERRFVPAAGHQGARPRLSGLLRSLRDPGLLALLAFAFLMMGGFVAVYNYLTFHLSRPPYSLPGALLGLVFLAYLGGTVASPVAGRLAGAHGRLPVMLGGMAVMAAGLLATLAGPLPTAADRPGRDDRGLLRCPCGGQRLGRGPLGRRRIAGDGPVQPGLLCRLQRAGMGSRAGVRGLGLGRDGRGGAGRDRSGCRAGAAGSARPGRARGRSGSEGSVGQIEHPHCEGQGGHADQDDPDQVQPYSGPGHLRDAHVPGAVGDGIGRGRDR